MDSMIITQEALRLPPTEKAHLIDALWSSLDGGDQKIIDEAWIAESLSRLKDYRSGLLQAVDGPAALDQLEAEFPR